MNFFEQLIIMFHVSSGFICLITGFLIFIFFPKGGKWHKRIGKVYVYSMSFIIFSAFLISIFIDFHIFLFCIAVFTGFVMYAGYRSIKRLKRPEFTKLDLFLSGLTLITGIIIIIYGLYHLSFSGISTISIISLFFGFIIFSNAYKEYKLVRTEDKRTGKFWLIQHLKLMIGSYIAILTAFLVQNGPKFIPLANSNWIYWISPAIIGIPISNYIVKKYKLKSEF